MPLIYFARFVLVLLATMVVTGLYALTYYENPPHVENILILGSAIGIVSFCVGILLHHKLKHLDHKIEVDPETLDIVELPTLTGKSYSDDMKLLIAAFLGELPFTYNAGNLFIGGGVMLDIFPIGALIRMEHIKDERTYWCAKLYLKHKTPRHSHWMKCEVIIDQWQKDELFNRRYEAILIPKYEKVQDEPLTLDVGMEVILKHDLSNGIDVDGIHHDVVDPGDTLEIECVNEKGDSILIDKKSVVRVVSDNEYTIHRPNHEEYQLTLTIPK